MSKSFLWLGLCCLLILACNKMEENEPTSNYSLTGKLSTFSCSDTSLNHRYKQLADNFVGQVDWENPSWAGLLPYMSRASQYLNKAPSPYREVDLMWASYLQEGKKEPIKELEIWKRPRAGIPELAAEATLVDILFQHQAFQRLAYLAIATSQDSLAQEFLALANGLFQEQIKGEYKLESHSFEQGIDADILGLAMDVSPEGEENAIIRNIFSQLLENQLSTSIISSSQHELLSLLSAYSQHDLATQLIDDMPDPIVGKWLISEVAGIKPNLNSPGFAQPILHPRPTSGLDYAEGQVKTSKGLLYLRWDDVKPFRIQVRVPEKASLVLPVSNPLKASIFVNKTRIWMGAKPQPTPEGVRYLDVNKDGVVVELDKGKYDFQIKN